ncbi:MAG: glutaredoxin family protein [Bacillota bacterium]|nr:glutaredoxin family protein [Bacillota bacterium]
MKNVIVYSSSTCPYCTLAKDYLNEKGVEFEERNISTSREAREELMAKGHTGVPVVIIDNEEIVGFDKARIDSLLDK